MTIITQHYNNRPRPRAVYRKHRPTMTENNASRYLIHATHLSLSILIDHPRLLGEGTRRSACLSRSVIIIDLTHARAYSHTYPYDPIRSKPPWRLRTLYFTHDTLLYLDTTHIITLHYHTTDFAHEVDHLGFLSRRLAGARS